MHYINHKGRKSSSCYISAFTMASNHNHQDGTTVATIDYFDYFGSIGAVEEN